MSGNVQRLEIWRAHRSRLIQTVLPIVGDRGSAEDVVQEAWLRFDHALQRDDAAVTHLVGYLYRITRNLALDVSRSRSARQRVEVADGRDVAEVAASQPLPEQRAIDQDALRHVATALAGLPPRTRAVFEMYRFGGLTLQQVADRLSISVGLAHHLVKQAVAACVDALEDEEI